MQSRFEGKAAIVTGAAQGLGKAVALRLAREGADLAAVDIQAAGSVLELSLIPGFLRNLCH